MNKKGQFFLAAAVVVILILIGLSSVYTYVRSSEEDLTLQQLSRELNYESSQVLDNGIFKSLNKNQINENIINLTSVYSNSNPESDLIFVYGNKEEATILVYNNTESGSIGINTGGIDSIELSAVTRNLKSAIFPPGPDDKISISIKNISYDFQLREGENFYLVIKKDKGDERLVAKN
jgi:hypothetical protein